MKTLNCVDSAGNEMTTIFQWDVDRVIKITNGNVVLGMNYELHFSSRGMRFAYVVEPDVDDGVLIAEIPAQLLTQPRSIDVYLYAENTTTNERRTVGSTRIAVMPRQEPDNAAEQPGDVLVQVPNGFVENDGKLYLARDGVAFGVGAVLSGGSGMTGDAYTVLSGGIAETITGIAETEEEA